MGYQYTDEQGKLIEVTQPESGSVTIYLREKQIATRYAKDFNGSLVGMKRWAERYIAERLDPIMSREDFYQVSYHISFGMTPQHSYVKEV